MKLSVPKMSSAPDANGHLFDTFEWERLRPGSVRWVDARVSVELVEWGLASKSLADWVKHEQRFLASEQAFQRAPFDSQTAPYKPLEDHPSLFKVFADLDGSEESFAAFAQKHGRLGLAVLSGDGGEDLMEAFSVWRLAWEDISECSRLLDLVQDGPTSELRKLVHFREKGIGVAFPGYDGRKRFPSQVGLVATKEPPLPGMRNNGRWTAIQNARTERARLEMAARFWVQAKATRWLSGYVFSESSARCVVVSDKGRSFGIRFLPSNLASAMWLQVARALEGDVAYRQCKSPKCRKWFVISSDRSLGRRSDSRYCGDPKCRKEVFREKQKRGRKR